MQVGNTFTWAPEYLYVAPCDSARFFGKTSLRRTPRNYTEIDYTGMDTIEPFDEYDYITNIWADQTIYEDPDYIPEEEDTVDEPDVADPEPEVPSAELKVPWTVAAPSAEPKMPSQEELRQEWRLQRQLAGIGGEAGLKAAAKARELYIALLDAAVPEELRTPLIRMRRTRRKYKKVDYTGMDTIEPESDYDGITNIWADKTINEDPDYVPYVYA